MAYGSDIAALIQGPHVDARIAEAIQRANTLYAMFSDNGTRVVGFNGLKHRAVKSRNVSRGTYQPGGTLARTANQQLEAFLHVWVTNYSRAVYDLDEMAEAGDAADQAAYLEIQLNNALMSLKEDLETQIWAAGTYGSKTVYEGLQTAIDDATNVAGYGNITRTAGANTWANSYVTAAVGAVSKAGLDTPILTLTEDDKIPRENLIFITTRTLLGKIIALYHSAERIEKDAAATPLRGGFTTPYTYGGIPITTGLNVPSGEVYLLNWPEIEFVINDKMNFYQRVTEGKDDLERTNDIFVKGQLKVLDPRTNYRLQGVT